MVSGQETVFCWVSSSLANHGGYLGCFFPIPTYLLTKKFVLKKIKLSNFLFSSQKIWSCISPVKFYLPTYLPTYLSPTWTFIFLFAYIQILRGKDKKKHGIPFYYAIQVSFFLLFSCAYPIARLGLIKLVIVVN